MTSITIKSEPSAWENFHPECRLCMSQESLGDIFKVEGVRQWMLDYLMIAVSCQDRISQAICASCRIQLTEFHRFRIRCQDAQSMILAESGEAEGKMHHHWASVAVKSEPKAWQNVRPVCRLCMSEESLGSIFRDEQLHQLILDYLKIGISREDRMSQAICAICRLQLTEFHQFRMRCHDVQAVLQSMTVDEEDDAELDGLMSCSKVECEPPCLMEYDEEKNSNSSDRLEQNRRNLTKHESGESVGKATMPIERVNIKNEPPAEEDGSYSDPQEPERELKSAMVQIPLDIIQKHERVTSTTKIQDNGTEIAQPNDVPQDAVVKDKVKGKPRKKKEVSLVNPCNLCNRVCTSRNKLRRHKQIVHGPRPHACEICNYTASLHRDLRKHLQTKMHFMKFNASLVNDALAVPINSKPIVDGDQSATNSDQSVNEHSVKVEIVESNGEEPKDDAGDELIQPTEGHDAEQQLQCDICQKLFGMDKQKLLDHKWYVHGANKYECSICGRPFMLRHRMLDHLRTHEGPRIRGKQKDQDHLAKPFKCEVCEKEFRIKRTFEYHRRQKHGLTENVCKICGKPFAYRYQLKEHMDLNDHSHVVRRRAVIRRPEADAACVDMRYKCNTCQKTFKLEGSLYAHQRTKHDRKPHRCSICDKPYAFQCQLKLHMKGHEDPNHKFRQPKRVTVTRTAGDGPLTRARSSRSQLAQSIKTEIEVSVE